MESNKRAKTDSQDSRLTLFTPPCMTITRQVADAEHLSVLSVHNMLDLRDPLPVDHISQENQSGRSLVAARALQSLT